MESEKHTDYYPGGLMYSEVIERAMKNPTDESFFVEHGFGLQFHFTPELQDILKDKKDIWRLHKMISSGFRTFKGEPPKYVGPVINLYTGYGSRKILSERIDMLIELSNTLDSKNMFGAIHTGKDSGFVIPVGLESNNGTDEMSDAEFLSEVVLSGFEVSDVE